MDRGSQNSSTAAQTPFRGSGGVSDAFVSTLKAYVGDSQSRWRSSAGPRQRGVVGNVVPLARVVVEAHFS